MTRFFVALTLIVASAALSSCASTKAAEAQAQKEALDARHRDAQRDFDRARANQEDDRKPAAPSR